MEDKILHKELCEKTAHWVLKFSKVVAYDYQSFASCEFPDVLAWNYGESTLYEIKVSLEDFLRDKEKRCRQNIRSTIKFIPVKIFTVFI